MTDVLLFAFPRTQSFLTSPIHLGIRRTAAPGAVALSVPSRQMTGSRKSKPFNRSRCHVFYAGACASTSKTSVTRFVSNRREPARQLMSVSKSSTMTTWTTQLRQSATSSTTVKPACTMT